MLSGVRVPFRTSNQFKDILLPSQNLADCKEERIASTIVIGR
jgi:hypothetical protein